MNGMADFIIRSEMDDFISMFFTFITQLTKSSGLIDLNL